MDNLYQFKFGQNYPLNKSERSQIKDLQDDLEALLQNPRLSKDTKNYLKEAYNGFQRGEWTYGETFEVAYNII